MRLDYIEIGTSDFDTLVETSDGIGISIEPLSFYLENLPNKNTNTKLNVAISDVDGEETIYFINPNDIISNKLPKWLKGCNSIRTPHPSALKILNELGKLHLYKSKLIKTITWDTLIRENNITYVDYLKLDTEGHDTVIINSILNSNLNLLPNKIFFESNVLTSREKIDDVLVKLKDRGYMIVQDFGDNILLELKKDLPTKIIFSSDDSGYLKYWKENSKLCSEILKITPVLLHITKEDSNFSWDEYGLVKKISYVGDTSLSAPISRLYSGSFFPNEKIMISDIDLFLFNRDFIKRNLVNSESYDITIIGSDAYDKNRSESKRYLSECSERFPMCYIVTNGNTLNEIMGINEKTTFSNFMLNGGFIHGIHSDEIIFSKNLLKTELKINRVNRGYMKNFYLRDRIEKRMFIDNNNLLKLTTLSGYNEFHCYDYDKYQSKIKHLLKLTGLDI